MVLGGGMKCVKYTLFAFNILIWLAGAGLLGIGIWIRVDKNMFDALLGSALYQTVGYIMIGTGGFVFIVGFCGCCGAIKENRCLLATYFTMLLIIFLVMITGCVLAYFYQDKVRDLVGVQMNLIVKVQYGMTRFAGSTIAMDEVQKLLKCCGYMSYADWANSMFYSDPSFASKRNNTVVPASCCKDPEESGCNLGTARHPSYIAKIYGGSNEGCLPALENWIRNNLLVIGGALLGVGMLLFIGMIFSCTLWRAVKDNEITKF